MKRATSSPQRHSVSLAALCMLLASGLASADRLLATPQTGVTTVSPALQKAQPSAVTQEDTRPVRLAWDRVGAVA